MEQVMVIIELCVFIKFDAILAVVAWLNSFFEGFLEKLFYLYEYKFIGNSDVDDMLLFIDTEDTAFLQKTHNLFGIFFGC